MTDWTQDETLRVALIAEIAAEMPAEMPAEMQPGDVTIEMLAESLGVTPARAAYALQKAERDGKLVSVRAVVPGCRVPKKVWRKVGV